MWRRLLSAWPYLGVTLAAIYLLPLLITDTGSAMAMLLLFLPTICWVAALVFHLFHPLNLLYPVVVAVGFVPTIFLYYNDSALIYVVLYGGLALVGSLLGRGIVWIRSGCPPLSRKH